MPEVGGGSIAQWIAFLFPDPADRGLIPSVPEFRTKENGDQTHLVLASGKLVQQKQWQQSLLLLLTMEP